MTHKGSFGDWMPHEPTPKPPQKQTESPDPPSNQVPKSTPPKPLVIDPIVAWVIWCTITGVITLGIGPLVTSPDERPPFMFMELGLLWWGINALAVIAFGWNFGPQTAKVWLRRIGQLLLMLLGMMIVTFLVAHRSNSPLW